MGQTRLQAVRELWSICFDDSEAFIELYFTTKYSDEVNKAIYDNERMISSMQLLPYPMTFCGTIIPTSYISGACTHPDFRKEGTMKQLLANSFIHMYNNGTLLCNLIPAEDWLFGYYQKFGFSTVFDYSIELIDTKSLPGTANEYEIAPYTSYQLDVHSYFDRKIKERPCCVQHPMDDFNVILSDLKISHGELYVARLNMEIVGMVFCLPGEDATYVTEIFAENPEIHNGLLKTAARQMENSLIKCIVPPETNAAHLGMARIINVEKMLQVYCNKYINIGFSIEVTDDLITENSDYYTLKHGTYERGFNPDTKYYKINIEQLTQLLLGYHVEQLPGELQQFPSQQPYMSLMLN